MAKRGINNEDVKLSNRALIIHIMQKNGVISRTHLARMSGLQQATITNIINDFLDWGLVHETGLIAGDNGRRTAGLELSCDKYRFISVQISQEYCTVATFDIRCNQYLSRSIEFDYSDSIPSILENIKNEIHRQRAVLKKEVLVGIGIAAVGPLIHESQSIAIHSGVSRLVSQDIRRALEEEFPVPVYFRHDAKAAAYMEWQRQFNVGDKGILIYIMTGVWLGSGIVIDGKVLSGYNGIAGEIGHMSIDYQGRQCECGRRGCLEQYASAFHIARSLQENIGDFPHSILKKDSNLVEVIAAYVKEDPLAVKILDEVGWALGVGISNVINVIDPNCIVIGNYFPQAGERLLKTIMDSIKERSLPQVYNRISIKFSDMGQDAPLRGITMLAIEDAVNNNRFFKN